MGKLLCVSYCRHLTVTLEIVQTQKSIIDITFFLFLHGDGVFLIYSFPNLCSHDLYTEPNMLGNCSVFYPKITLSITL